MQKAGPKGASHEHKPAGWIPPTIILVHGASADGSGWQGVHNLLKDTCNVRIVQEPNLSLEGDVAATKMIIGQQSEPVILVGHSYGGAVITEAGNDPEWRRSSTSQPSCRTRARRRSAHRNLPARRAEHGDAICRLRRASCYSTGKSSMSHSRAT